MCCDRCALWFHADCIGLAEQPGDAELWLCPFCTAAQQQEDEDATKGAWGLELNFLAQRACWEQRGPRDDANVWRGGRSVSLGGKCDRRRYSSSSPKPPRSSRSRRRLGRGSELSWPVRLS